jgi:hypothetical protein
MKIATSFVGRKFIQTDCQLCNYELSVSCNRTAEVLNLVAIMSLCNDSLPLSDNGIL